MPAPSSALLPGPDRKLRCLWGASAPEYLPYHDEEWGLPTADDVRLFEKVCLEGSRRASLATILRKRDAFARLAGFDIVKVSRFGARDVRASRRRGSCAIAERSSPRSTSPPRLRPATSSARLRPTSGASSRTRIAAEAAHLGGARAMTTTPASVALSKDRRRGWTFVGPTTIYAFMQAVGIVNDHLDGCAFRARAERARRAFERPR
jgi:DNA-3-methyladenine glycosylase I